MKPAMFFRRQRPQPLTFQDRIEKLKAAGFTVEPRASGVRASRDGCAALIEDVPGGRPQVNRAGLLAGSEIAQLADAGYQKFWVTADGRRRPVLASQLHALHAFEEDLKEALGLESLYHQSLGTVNDVHVYDRVADRDQGVPRRPWER